MANESDQDPKADAAFSNEDDDEATVRNMARPAGLERPKTVAARPKAKSGEGPKVKDGKTGAWDPYRTLGERDLFIDEDALAAPKPKALKISASGEPGIPIVSENKPPPADKTQLHQMDISLSEFSEDESALDPFDEIETGSFQTLSQEGSSEGADVDVTVPKSQVEVPKTGRQTTPLPKRSPGASRLNQVPADEGLHAPIAKGANMWKVVPTAWRDNEGKPPEKPAQVAQEPAVPPNLQSVKTVLWSRPSGEENELDETQRAERPEGFADAINDQQHTRQPTVALASVSYVQEAIEFVEGIDVSQLPAEAQLAAKANIAGAVGKLKRALALLGHS